MNNYKYVVSRCIFILLFFSSLAFGQSEVDLLVVYSPSAKALMTDPNARIVSYVEYANQALKNTGADFQYRLVHVEEHSWSGDSSLGGTELNNLRINASIQQLRNRYGADFVAGIVPQTNGLCGIGYVLNGNNSTQKFSRGSEAFGYSLTGHSCGGHSFSHELGHNMGLGHSYAQGSKGGLADWARGHGLLNEFITIMAYSSAYDVSNRGGVLQIHSNPDLNSCLSFSCGIDRFAPDGADARRALDIAAPQVAGFLPTVGTMPPQSIVFEDAEDGTINGWRIADNTPSGVATIANVFDGAAQSRVIELSGLKRQNSFRLGKDENGRLWREQNLRMIQWSMKYSVPFTIYIQLETTGGRRNIVYQEGVGLPLVLGPHVRIGLGAGITDGTWRTNARNLEDDLHRRFPSEQILNVDGFVIRGSGRVDDIELLSATP